MLGCLFGKATEVPQTWDRFSNDACYRKEQEVEVIEEDEDGDDLVSEAEDSGLEESYSSYDMPSASYTRHLVPGRR